MARFLSPEELREEKEIYKELEKLNGLDHDDKIGRDCLNDRLYQLWDKEMVNEEEDREERELYKQGGYIGERTVDIWNRGLEQKEREQKEREQKEREQRAAREQERRIRFRIHPLYIWGKAILF